MTKCPWKLLWVIVPCLLFSPELARSQGQNSATWAGGNGNFTNSSQWLCVGPSFPVPSPCVPNGNFILDLSSGGTLNIDTNVTASSIGGGGVASLSLNGTTLTVGSGGVTLNSLTLTNGAAINNSTGSFGMVNLTMQNSTVNSQLSVSGSGNVSGTANISGSTVQQLVVDGGFTISNSTLGNNSVLLNSGQSIISGTSFSGELELIQSGSVVIDNGSVINSVLFGIAAPVDVEAAGTSSTLTIQGGSQLNINGSDLVLGGLQTTTGTLVLNDTSSITANNENIGIFGTGQFTQTNGTNTASGQVTLAEQAGSSTYTLSGGQLSAGNVLVGGSGSGTFTQSGGTNTVNSTLTLGSAFGGVGTYNLSGGQLAAGDEIVGADGSGEIVQNGGSNTVAGTLTLASSISGSGTGTYSLSNAGSSLSAASEVIGQFGTGQFTQSGGTNQVSGTLTLGRFIGIQGNYDLRGTGQLTAGNEVIGDLGDGSFTQAFGSQTFNSTLGTITLGAQKGSNGTYVLIGAGNDVFAANEVIGDSGVGVFTENSGADNKITGTLTLGKSASGTAEYDLKGGTLEAGTETIGADGLSATFNHTGGTNTVSGNLGISASGSALGTYNLSGSSTLSAASETLGNDPCLILSCPVSGTFNQAGSTTNSTGTLTINFGSYNLNGGTLQAVKLFNNGALALSGNGTLAAFDLTIGNAGIMTISGQSAGVIIGNSTTNNGAIIEFGAGTLQWGAYQGGGSFQADPATNSFTSLSVLTSGYITSNIGDLFKVAGNFQNLSTQNTLWNTGAAELLFTGGGTHIFDLAGQNGAGFSKNFAWGTLAIDPGNTLDLSTGSGNALYVDFLQGLTISGTTITNIDGAAGLFLYYNPADNPFLQGNYSLTGGGQLIAAGGTTPTPEPSSMLLFGTGLVGLSLGAFFRRKTVAAS